MERQEPAFWRTMSSKATGYVLKLFKAPAEAEPKPIKEMSLDELSEEMGRLILSSAETDRETKKILEGIPELERRAVRVRRDLQRIIERESY